MPKKTKNPTGIHIELSPKLFKRFEAHCKRLGYTKKQKLIHLIQDFIKSQENI